MKIFYSILVLSLSAPTVVWGQAISSSLLNIPGRNGDPLTFSDYINWLYVFSISVAALLAVVKIIIAGFKYIGSDVVSNKSAAKDDIKGALLGLLLILGVVIILETINPNLVNSTINIEAVEPAPAGPTGQAGPGGGVGVIPGPSGGGGGGGGAPTPTPSPSGPNPAPGIPSNQAPSGPCPVVNIKTETFPLIDTREKITTETRDFSGCPAKVAEPTGMYAFLTSCRSQSVPGKIKSDFSGTSLIYTCVTTYYR